MATAVKKTTGKRRVGDGTPGPGRPPGSQNKTTKELKDMILGALDRAGGETYLEGCAKDPRTASAFLTLVGKVLPKDLNVKASVTLADIVREARAQINGKRS